MKLSCLLFTSTMFFFASVLIAADNLILNSEFDRSYREECKTECQGKVSYENFTENSTWNKCLKLVVLGYKKDKQNKDFINAYVRIGGARRSNGFVVKPNTTYFFQLEIKSDISIAVIVNEWHGPGYWKDLRRRRIGGKTSLRIPPSPEWTVVKGKFTTAGDATHAGLEVLIFGQEQYLPKLNGYVMIDKVKVKEGKDLLSALKAKKRIVIKQQVPLKKVAADNVPIRDFIRSDGKAPEASTVVAVVAGEKNITFKIRCTEPAMDKLKTAVSAAGGEVWADDHVEIFFAPVTGDRLLSQFVVTAGGGKWMGQGRGAARVDKNSEWSAEVTREKDAWTVVAQIPYTLLGWKSKPESGTAIGLNIGRVRTHVPELSSWSHTKGDFHAVRLFGILILGTREQFIQHATTALEKDVSDELLRKRLRAWKPAVSAAEDYRCYENFKQEAVREKFKNRTFILTRTLPTQDPSIPYLPDNIATPSDKFTLRAAGNTFEPLVLALTNLTTRAEEYRIVCGSFESYNHIRLGGLKTDDGTAFPASKLKLYRGIRMKDGNEKNPGQRFDALAPMDVTGTVVVLPGESTPVWVIFNTHGVKPGVYKGAIQVIPLGEWAQLKVTDYTGPMRQIPLEFEVLPYEVATDSPFSVSFFQRPFNQEAFRMMLDYGCNTFIDFTYYIKAKFLPDGSIANTDTKRFEKEYANFRKWQGEVGFKGPLKIDFFYNAYVVFRDVHAKKQFKPHSTEWAKAWGNYVRLVDLVRRKCGIANGDFRMELIDEPKPEIMDELVEVAKIAHEACPEMNLAVTLAAWDIPMKKLEQLLPYVQTFILWQTKYFANIKYNSFMNKLRIMKKNVGIYQCSTSMRLDLQSYYRAFPWTALAYNCSYMGNYEFMTYMYKYHDWKLAAKGSTALMAAETPISTIRQECIRIGLTDLKYFKKLSDTMQSAKNISSELRTEVESFLKDSPKKCVYVGETFEKRRNKMIELTMAVRGTK